MTRRTVVTMTALVPGLGAADSTADRAKRMIADLQSAQKAPGACAAVWKAGSMVWSGAFGQSDLEDGAQATSETRFRIGSLSKLLTAAAAARLYEKGVLDLDAPVQQYVPGFPAKSGKITPCRTARSSMRRTPISATVGRREGFCPPRRTWSVLAPGYSPVHS
jgi:CubicO group peptidase (beta-lactamase class C family)